MKPLHDRLSATYGRKAARQDLLQSWWKSRKPALTYALHRDHFFTTDAWFENGMDSYVEQRQTTWLQRRFAAMFDGGPKRKLALKVLVDPLSSVEARQQVAEYLGHSQDPRGRAFVRSAFRRDEPSSSHGWLAAAERNAAIAYIGALPPTARWQLAVELLEEKLSDRHSVRSGLDSVVATLSELEGPQAARVVQRVLDDALLGYTRADHDLLRSTIELAAKYVTVPSVRQALERYASQQHRSQVTLTRVGEILRGADGAP